MLQKKRKPEQNTKRFKRKSEKPRTKQLSKKLLVKMQREIRLKKN